MKNILQLLGWTAAGQRAPLPGALLRCAQRRDASSEPRADDQYVVVEACHELSPIHLSADREGRKKYSPPRSTLKVSIPWMRRRTGSCGMVNVAPSCCRPTLG